jgi:hypothetical protein
MYLKKKRERSELRSLLKHPAWKEITIVKQLVAEKKSSRLTILLYTPGHAAF